MTVVRSCVDLGRFAVAEVVAAVKKSVAAAVGVEPRPMRAVQVVDVNIISTM
jgi:hypothetical protein